jgi:hypothetical protein
VSRPSKRFPDGLGRGYFWTALLVTTLEWVLCWPLALTVIRHQQPSWGKS